jgi:prepilin-type N-terminal cleavage/methylation domain-containing protein
LKTSQLSQPGFSLVEITIVLMVVSVLSSVMAPAIGNFVATAKIVRARSDAQTVAVGLARFVFDVGNEPALPRSWSGFDVLVGAGEVPGGSGPGVEPWRASVRSGRAASLDDHLVTNGPGYSRRACELGSMFCRGWAGPYIEAGVGSDPWGFRYAVGVRHLAGRNGFDTFVISAGPNGIIETPFDVDGVTPRGDDIIAVIAGD